MGVAVLSLLIAQLALGVYQLTFVLDAGHRRASNARGSRLPDPLVFGHPLLALTTLALWVAWMESDEVTLAWVALGSLGVTAAGGLAMFARTVTRGRMLEPPRGDGADMRVAEKRIPTVALAAHGIVGLAIALCMVLDALGW